MKIVLRMFLFLALLCVGMAAGCVPESDNDRGEAALKVGDIKIAVKWYRKAAEKGDADAQNMLGLMYLEGRGAFRFLPVESVNMMDLMSLEGRGVPEDHAEAVKWFRKAAEQGHALAQYNLGRMYLEGRGVPQNDAEAMKWFRKAAEQGDADAQTMLGFMHLPADKWGLSG